jgi:hypothetical protein
MYVGMAAQLQANSVLMVRTTSFLEQLLQQLITAQQDS